MYRANRTCEFKEGNERTGRMTRVIRYGLCAIAICGVCGAAIGMFAGLAVRWPYGEHRYIFSGLAILASSLFLMTSAIALSGAKDKERAKE